MHGSCGVMRLESIVSREVLYIIIGVAAVLLVAGIVFASIVLWRRQVRRSLIALTGRREAVAAAYKALESVFTALAEGDTDSITAFAIDSTSVHRKALEELHHRMRIQSEELADIALPKRLWQAADLLGTAAGKLAVETGRVGEAGPPEKVLEVLGKIDVAGISAALRPANEAVDALLEELKVEDPSVYGGGLYI
jgi:flagellar basal body-associated protein FliL